MRKLRNEMISDNGLIFPLRVFPNSQLWARSSLRAQINGFPWPEKTVSHESEISDFVFIKMVEQEPQPEHYEPELQLEKDTQPLDSRVTEIVEMNMNDSVFDPIQTEKNEIDSQLPEKNDPLDTDSNSELFSKTVVELRNLCKEKGVSTKGNKQELINRLTLK